MNERDDIKITLIDKRGGRKLHLDLIERDAVITIGDESILINLDKLSAACRALQELRDAEAGDRWQRLTVFDSPAR